MPPIPVQIDLQDHFSNQVRHDLAITASDFSLNRGQPHDDDGHALQDQTLPHLSSAKWQHEI